jgi:hypothetical protein
MNEKKKKPIEEKVKELHVISDLIYKRKMEIRKG